MMKATSLVALFIGSVSLGGALVGCVTSADDEEATRAPGGGGKADDANCEAEAYRTWMTGTMIPAIKAAKPIDDEERATLFTLAADMPCQTGRLADFDVWAAQWTPVVTSMIANTPFVQPNMIGDIRTQADWDAAVAAAVPTSDVQNLLAVLAEVRPVKAPKAAYKKWLERYDQAVNFAYAPVNYAISTNFERAGVVNAAEEPMLAAIELAKVDSDEKGSHEAFLLTLKPLLERAYKPTGSAEEQLLVARFLDAIPSARSDADYGNYLVYFETQTKRAYAPATYAATVQGKVNAIIDARPSGPALTGDAKSYRTWLERFSANLEDAVRGAGAAAAVDAREKAQLDAWIAVKPCTSDMVTAQSKYELLDAERATFAANATFVDAAAPVECN